MIKTESSPGTVTAERGQVTLDGPDGVVVSLTPEAAAETGRRLIAAAEEALTQSSDDAPFD